MVLELASLLQIPDILSHSSNTETVKIRRVALFFQEKRELPKNITVPLHCFRTLAFYLVVDGELLNKHGEENHCLPDTVMFHYPFEYLP